MPKNTFEIDGLDQVAIDLLSIGEALIAEIDDNNAIR